MFSHIMLGADDMEKSRKFYDAIMEVLGHKPGVMDDKGRCFYMEKTGIFSLSVPINGEPASGGNGSTIGFVAENPETIDKWHEVGLANGGTTLEDPPGVREGAGGKLYLAYLRDPGGNKICALHRLA
ncbi:VOC family protein [Kordiimonas laminariae]|uniref:VOC family protein n=1 Tax=Kordiimonas laminariae TaxID=2917717 RepID=UPI001FF37ABE|nr:VOC family protein [Kordiimonas laminariae]MCK0068152.1 VOC family protein [Kordiimonas laminariae]